MVFELPPLPYEMNALEPYISEETLQYHYGKHHRAYVNKLNELTKNNSSGLSLEEIIMQSKSGPVFNNAGQVWNHTFYWNCMKKSGGGEPRNKLADAIKQHFGSFEEFRKKFDQAATGQFGSGWAWLVKHPDGKLEVYSTSNAGTPMTENKKAILTCDVWEHAYYIDTRNDRAKYVENFWQVVNWDFVSRNFEES
jgi:superoxide dismutase, Fe-Mn family